MHRPVMNPELFDDSPKARPRRKLLRLIGQTSWRWSKLMWRLVTYDPLRLGLFRVEEGTPLSRFTRGLLYRLAFVPVFLAMIACAIVWVATHPFPATGDRDPSSQGIYYDAVTFVGPDRVRLDGWLVPLLDARTVLEEKDLALRRRYPAIILAHDAGQRREHLLPLVKPLHDAGFVVLAVNLRGGTGSASSVGLTFGLMEARDLKAAVEMLRRRNFIDPNRIGLVGFGSGATAALIAAREDPRVAAVVADQPIKGVADLVSDRLMPPSAWLTWMGPLCKWTFEIAYGVDAEEVELSQQRELFASRRVLMVDDHSAQPDPADPRIIDQLKGFLMVTIGDPPPVVAKSAP